MQCSKILGLALNNQYSAGTCSTQAKGICHSCSHHRKSSQQLASVDESQPQLVSAGGWQAERCQRAASGQPDLQEEAQLLNEVSLRAPGVPVLQLEHGVAGQRAQQRRRAARAQQADGGRGRRGAVRA